MEGKTNIYLYEQMREVPENAQKTIKGGRLSGFTDINPMWRIKKLTEEFGPAGIGWTPKITKQWVEEGADGQIACFTNIELIINGFEFPISGTGGSMYVAKEKSGLYVDDDCYKKAFTDAIGNACKSLGMGADIYWGSDATKYDVRVQSNPYQSNVIKSNYTCAECGEAITPITLNVRGHDTDYSPEQIVNSSLKRYGEELCFSCATKRKEDIEDV